VFYVSWPDQNKQLKMVKRKKNIANRISS